MTRKEQRKRIDQAIKEITIPFLREQGFKGFLPHFRRVQSDRINLLTFQHSMSRPQFVVEIANCPLEGIITSWDKKIEPSKCTAHTMMYRFRIGNRIHKTDYWFDYGETSLITNIYKKRAKEVIELWNEAEDWWKEDPYEQRIKK